MNKFILLITLCSFGTGAWLEGNAQSKQPKIHSVYLEKKRTDKGVRSIKLPLNVEFTADGNNMTLYSPENCDMAYITISGENGDYLTDMVVFTNKAATLDVSDLGVSSYQITVEFESGAIYDGGFEFLGR